MKKKQQSVAGIKPKKIFHRIPRFKESLATPVPFKSECSLWKHGAVIKRSYPMGGTFYYTKHFGSLDLTLEYIENNEDKTWGRERYKRPTHMPAGEPLSIGY